MTRLNGRLTTSFVDLARDGDKVFLRFTSTGLSSTGLTYDQTYCWAMKFREGRIAEIVAYLDTNLLRSVLI